MEKGVVSRHAHHVARQILGWSQGLASKERTSSQEGCPKLRRDGDRGTHSRGGVRKGSSGAKSCTARTKRRVNIARSCEVEELEGMVKKRQTRAQLKHRKEPLTYNMCGISGHLSFSFREDTGIEYYRCRRKGRVQELQSAFKRRLISKVIRKKNSDPSLHVTWLAVHARKGLKSEEKPV